MAYWQPVPGHAVPGEVEPQGYSRCWLPPAAAYSHSASLGRNPPSQMQKAYASCHVTQLIGRFSWLAAVFVQVAKLVLGSHTALDRLPSVGATLPLSDVTHPVSYMVAASGGAPTFTSPRPPLRWVCLPDPIGGV